MRKHISNGYTGKTLRVDLTRQQISVEETSEELCRKYLGGAGFISHYLLQELGANIDPLGPDNKLIMATGPLTGLPFSGSGRHGVGTKSPLSGGVVKSEVGEFWGSELKRAGIDAVIIEGRAEKPVYLWIQDGEAGFKDAGHLRGQNTKETQQQIRTELGDNLVRVASIGPGGENLVRYACIMHGLYDAAGRGGTGAVMGSKNLKAIAVRGHGRPKMADSKPARDITRWLKEKWGRVEDFAEYGTGSGMDGFEETGNLPVRNFRDGLFPNVRDIDAVTVRKTIRTGMDACFACAVRCKKVVKIDTPYSVDPAYGGPEYETLASIGSNCGIDDLAAIAKGSELCNAYSLDTISTGEVIAFAMECFENGLLSTKDTGGIELRFGNTEAMLRCIELIARREGIGKLLAEGSVRAAKQIGGKAEQFAIAVKGLEAGMHEPRAKPGLGLGFMVNPHGADHCCNLHDTLYLSEKSWRVQEAAEFGVSGTFPAEDIGPEKVRLFHHVQRGRIVLDCLLVCLFLPYNLTQLSELVNAATGWQIGGSDLLKVADRTLTNFRLFNMREGFTAADDTLPQRFYQPKTDGVLADKPLDPAKMEAAKRYYYTLMGWDENTGAPKEETLKELGI